MTMRAIMHGVNPLKMRRLPHAKRLEERGNSLLEINIGDPSKPLIELPVDLPTIPVVGPLLAPLITPLIGGPQPANSPEPTTQAPAPQSPSTTPAAPLTSRSPTVPQQPPASASPSPNPGDNPSGSNGDHTGGSDGGNSGQSGGSGNGTDKNGDTNVPSITPPNSPSAPNSNNGANSESGPSPSAPTIPPHSATSGLASQDSSGGDIVGNPTDTVVPTAPKTFQAAVNVQQTPGVSDSSDLRDFIATLTAPGFQPTSSRPGSTVIGDVLPSSGASPISNLGGGSSTGGGGSGSIVTKPTTPADDHSKHGLSKGAIAAIAVVSALVGIVFLFFIARKCSRSKRAARRRRWFLGGEQYCSTAPMSSDQYFAKNRTSHRSSFGTTFDRGRPMSSADPFNVPWPLPRTNATTEPDMVETSNDVQPLSISVPSPAHPIDRSETPLIRTSLTSNDGSLHSALELPSMSHSQVLHYLPVTDNATPRPDGAFLPLPSPISVRPFSPSESFSFPSPPKDELKRQSDAILSLRSQSIVHPPNSSQDDFYSAEDPFADFTSVESHVTADSGIDAHFAETETIRRPFIPTMDDEIAVQPGDEVRVLRRFDDGWALAEKVGDGTRGLFPIDCLRMQNQDLPAFLAAKRISSYSGPKPFRESVIGQAV